MEGLQMVLNTLRPAVIALILTSGITILTQAIFQESHIDLQQINWIQGSYFYHLYVPFIEKEKRSDHCHAVCGCAKCDWKLFYFIGNFNEIPYEIKKPSGQDRTAAEGKFVAEATRRRRRILQSRILSCGNINDESVESINKTIGSDRFE